MDSPRQAAQGAGKSEAQAAPTTNEAATPRRIRPDIGQVVLVFQGGGALGAYQAGVYEALHEAGIEPDWIIGTSIGAINASLVASPFKSAYVAAKHAIVGLTKVTALEAAEAGITCNAICPGYVYTPLVEAQIEGQAKAHGIAREAVIRDVLLAQQPNKRFATVEEMGAIALFLASAGAASITGVALPADGGWTAH